MNSNPSRYFPDQSLADQKFARGVHLVLEMVHVSSHEAAPVVSPASHCQSITSKLEGWPKETGVTAGVQDGQRRFGRRGKKMDEEKQSHLEVDSESRGRARVGQM